MTPEKKAIYRMLFHNKLAKVTGMDFQNIFSEIMQYADSNHKPIKPQGSHGDWKNDGYNPFLGHYYQVYSPENLSESEAILKLDEDFAGLVSKWNGNNAVFSNGVKHFSFVLNDYFRVTPGGYPTTVAKLESLRVTHGLETCQLFLAKDLEDVLLGLDEDKVISIVGFCPNPSEIGVLDYSLVNEVVEHIIENSQERSLKQLLLSPDFNKKLNFNNLNVTAHWLTEGNYRSGTLENYFSANSKVTRQDIRDKLKGIYEQSKSLPFPASDGVATSSDLRLNHILNEITPIKPTADMRMKKELQDAALVVMAYFFESCDIFEEPNNANA